MSAESSFNSLITNDANINAIVSNRIYPVKLKQNIEYPALMYRVDAAESEEYLRTVDYPPLTFYFEVNLYTRSYAELVNLSDALRSTFRASNYNISSIEDNKYDDELATYTRTIGVTIVSNE